ncbi:MAG: glutamine synthetase [Clostridia bacterium]|nr:glutamine synthetase [Clostridia bacterium]
MNYTEQEVMQFAEEEDVKFIRLAVCDVFGKPKNVSIMKDELKRAFQMGIAIDGSAIVGFGDEAHSDLFLHPDPNTLSVLPWRPEHGRVVRMYCTISYPDGTPFVADTRKILSQAVETAKKEGIAFRFGTEIEFYLFKLDEFGNKTNVPYDNAGYMDVSPDDKGENIRREICLTLEQMGIYPESSHHEEGPGQNEIDFRYSSPLEAADNAQTFRSVVGATAMRNGVAVDFSPKPLSDKAGNGVHINFSAESDTGEDVMGYAIAGILKHISALTAFLNPTEASYKRLGEKKAPAYISWAEGNRSQLIRVPAASGEYRRAELRSPDPTINPYIAFSLLIYAALDGIKNKIKLPLPTKINLFNTTESVLQKYKRLPRSLSEANELAKKSKLIKKVLPSSVIDTYTER